jgi:dihydropteroate synthase
MYRFSESKKIINKSLASKDKAFYSKKTLNINGKVLDVSRPKVMGILNVTDDSFYDGGKFFNKKQLSAQAEKMIMEGADIIDIGGYSSRPGARTIDEKTEFLRVKAGIEATQEISKTIPISIDTFRSEVAQKSIDLGADIINDISGGELDPEMYETVSSCQIPYVVMHMVGTPQNMMQNTIYDDIHNEIINYFAKKLEQLTHLGIKDVIIDIGFGFSKTTSQNHELLNQLKLFQILNSPVLVGISRKSMIFKILGTSPEQALNGTSALNAVAILKKASILRVHDVKEAIEVIDLLDYYNIDSAF